MSTEQKPKRTRAPRRNFERELTELRRFVEISIEIWSSETIDEAGPAVRPQVDGRLAAYRAVLARLGK